jgi:hypothetical protein
MNRTLNALLAIVLGLSLGAGCKKKEAPPSETKEPAEAAEDAAAVPAEPDQPEGDAPKTMTAKDGAVTVTLPEGEGWECLDQQGPMPDKVNQVSLVKCRRADRDKEFFFLMAKVYGVNESEVKPAKDLATEVFMASYKQLFQDHKVVKEGAVKMGSLEGYETVLEMTHPQMGPISKVERVFTQGENVFVLSGEGKPENVEKFAKATSSWFDQTRFKALEK